MSARSDNIDSQWKHSHSVASHSSVCACYRSAMIKHVALESHTTRLVVPILANKFAFAINFETSEYILGPVVLSARNPHNMPKRVFSPYHGILPKSGGLLSSKTCIHPPLPAEPTPPCPLDPPLESALARRRLAF